MAEFKYKMDNKNGMPYNTAYLNLSLLDELDYVIGGYGKPNQGFIYTLNSFIETYVLNETFFFSVLEWKHFLLTNKSILTNGRPIRAILIKKDDTVVFKDWSIDVDSKVLYSKPVVEGKNEIQYCMDEFQKTASKEIKDKFFKPAVFLESNQKYAYLTSNFGFHIVPNDVYIIYDHKQTPSELLRGLYESTSNDNFQVAIPFNGVKSQLSFNASMLPSNKSIKILSKVYEEKREKLSSYTGYKKIPIPPLVSILLSQCKNLEDIPVKLEQLREDFTELRNSFTELEKKIDTAENMKEQMDAVDGLESFWIAFDKKYDSGANRLIHHFWDIKKSSGVTDATEKVIDSGEFEGFLSNLNAVSLTGKALSKIYSYFDSRKALNRFKGMTNLWELFQKSPTLEKQAKDYERIFKVKIDLKELNRLHKIINS